MNIISIFQNWFSSYFGKQNDSHNIKISLLIALAIFGGYTVSNYPKKILNIFNKFYVQIIILTIIYYISYDKLSPKIKLYYSIFDALFIVGILNAIPFIYKHINNSF